MKKLIVKSQLANLRKFEQQMAGMGMEFSPVIWQHERIYLPHDYRPEMNFPRLVMRTEVIATNQPAVYAMYLKRHIEDSGVDWVNYTQVKDYTEASGIIHQLGFRKVAEVSRQRRELALDEKIRLYLDKVEGLNEDFLKIEAELREGEAVDAMRYDLFNVLKMLGQTTFTMQPYFELVRDGEKSFVIPR